MNADNERCGNCRFWNCFDHTEPDRIPMPPKLIQMLRDTYQDYPFNETLWNEYKTGNCRRYPPQLPPNTGDAKDETASFPVTCVDCWCGEWKAEDPTA
jgi:hypothetical protein